jgi:hypothetical protein
MTKGIQKSRVNRSKLVLGLMVASVSVIVGTAGVAGATMHGNGMGHGYGGGVNIDIGHIIGDNNVIIIIVNYIMGS